MIKSLNSNSKKFNKELNKFLNLRIKNINLRNYKVFKIVDDVKKNGDKALIKYEKKLNANSNGNIVLKLPRENIESKTTDGIDEAFIILISKTGLDSGDFVEVQFEEIETGPDFRTVRIQFEEDDRWIKVIGTYVIPEFGTIVTMILLIAVTTTIIMSKSKFSVKYN